MFPVQVLQLYAAKTLAGGGSGAAAEGSAEAALERLLTAQEDEWDGLLREPGVQQARARSLPDACPSVLWCACSTPQCGVQT